VAPLPERPLGTTGETVAVLGLGGHEFLPTGKFKGFSDDPPGSRQAGYRQPGFGGPVRRAVVRRALDLGLRYFDITIDPEVEALGRNLREFGQRDAPILVQARPQGFCYNIDPGNRRMADREELTAEVDRLRVLLGRPVIEVLNVAFEAAALEADSAYLDKIETNIRILKDSGRIRYAACDGRFSGESHYLRVMERGCFDIVWINYSLFDPFAASAVFPLAQSLGMGVVTREAFRKGQVFRLGSEILPGVPAGDLAAVALRWILRHPAVSTVVVGVPTPEQLERNAQAVTRPYSDQDEAIVSRLTAHPAFVSARAEREARFRATKHGR
jgi:aryl-alcohol dehydrogenase-like predicted oxidoreductase